MNIDIVRNDILEKKGSLCQFRFNGSRNQVEKFTGVITSVYPSIFIVESSDSVPKVKSFTYNDIITSSLEIVSK
ncbi:MAG: Veg family protein [Bacilli bacterium]|nr:Veg family protein [Bacilli bacterium]